MDKVHTHTHTLREGWDGNEGRLLMGQATAWKEA